MCSSDLVWFVKFAGILDISIAGVCGVLSCGGLVGCGVMFMTSSSEEDFLPLRSIPTMLISKMTDPAIRMYGKYSLTEVCELEVVISAEIGVGVVVATFVLSVSLVVVVIVLSVDVVLSVESSSVVEFLSVAVVVVLVLLFVVLLFSVCAYVTNGKIDMDITTKRRETVLKRNFFIYRQSNQFMYINKS